SEPDSLAYGGNSQSDDTPDNDNPSPTVGINIGNEAPDFTLADTYGEDVILSNLRGKPVLLFFWATGCPACEQQYPRIQEFYDSYSDSLTVLAVNLGDDPNLINAYLGDRDLTFPCVVATSDVQIAYDVYSVPHAFLLDDEGLVSFADHPGYLSDVILQSEFQD
ncbi:MAG: redoxin domain-containing protein, partial [bacterium]|nr:redoxin domain-containing protein [bacterium]